MGREIRQARLAAGLSQADVARASARSQPRISRIERGIGRSASLVELCAVASVIGLKLVVQTFPVLDRLRDAGQLRLLAALETQIPQGAGWCTEVPMPARGDLRALDALISFPECRIAVEAWTRLGDIQAQVRSAELKRRDIGADRLVILLADSRHNREALRAAEPMLREQFPRRTRAVMAALSRRRDPGGDGLVILRLGRSGQPRRRGGYSMAESKGERD
jgi:transcriptional regulator with XRE-family HTH domain